MSIIQSLIDEGVCVLYHDYRAGHLDDLSGNSNDGTPTGTQWTNNGLTFKGASDLITVTDSAELQLTAGTLIVFGDFNSQTTNEAFIAKRDGGGTNYQFWLSTSTRIRFYDGTDQPFVDTTVIDKKYAAVNFANGETPELFIDGISAGNFSASVAISANDANLFIGGHANLANLESPLKAALVINRKLTATEHAELFAELESIHYPKKTEASAQVDVQADPSDSSLVGAWNMKPVNNTVVDLSPSGNDLTVNGSVWHEPSVLGDSMVYGNTTSDYLGNTSPSNLDFTDSDPFTVEVWFNTNAVGTAQELVQRGSGTFGAYFLRLLADGTVQAQVIDTSNNSAIKASANAIAAETINHAVLVYDGVDTVELFLNGVSEGTDQDASISGNLFSDTAIDFGVGISGTTTIQMDGIIYGVAVYSEAKDSDWVAIQYAKGASAVQFKPDFGANVSPANVTAGFIENTPFQVSTGGWTITTDTINGKKVKVLNCVSGGICYVPIDFFKATPTEAWHGTHDFWLYKNADGNTCNIIFGDTIGGWNDGSQDGYLFQFNSSEAITLYKVTAGSVAGTERMFTANGNQSIQTWLNVKITVSNAGVLTTYIDGTAVTADTGTNPFTSTTNTSIDYLLFDLDGGDKIALGSADGDEAIVKYLGVK